MFFEVSFQLAIGIWHFVAWQWQNTSSQVPLKLLKISAWFAGLLRYKKVRSNLFESFISSSGWEVTYRKDGKFVTTISPSMIAVVVAVVHSTPLDTGSYHLVDLRCIKTQYGIPHLSTQVLVLTRGDLKICLTQAKKCIFSLMMSVHHQHSHPSVCSLSIYHMLRSWEGKDDCHSFRYIWSGWEKVCNIRNSTTWISTTSIIESGSNSWL